jgi:hypothetical protein
VALNVLVVFAALASRHPPDPEPASAAELALVASAFHREYQTNGVGLVWNFFELCEVTPREYRLQHNGRWRRNLVRSNPSAMWLYRSSDAVDARAMDRLS